MQTNPADPTRRCVAPTCQDYGPDNPTAASSGWLRKVIDDGASKALVCNDGCPYVYYVRPGVGADASKWLVYFKGGGDCFDDASCAQRWAGSMRHMTQPAVSFSPTGGNAAKQLDDTNGIFSRGRNDNVFKDWTQVYLPYCSSDTFTGDRMADDHPLGLYFRGHAISNGVLEELLIGAGGLSLTDATDVLIAGGSAGANGARNNMDRMAARIREAQTAANASPATIKGLIDSIFVPTLSAQGYDLSTEPRADYWNAVTDDDCLAAHPGDQRGLCLQSMHMVTGKGSVPVDQQDSGHLHTVDDVFVFMDQYDGKALEGSGITSACVRSECDPGACSAGEVCVNGLCYEPTSCTPVVPCVDEPCGGAGLDPACLEEAATHAGYCTTDDDCGVAGEACVYGICQLDQSLRCDDPGARSCDVAAGFACGVDGVCFKSMDDAAECESPNTYVEDLSQCREVRGCSAESPCPTGYHCMDRRRSPRGQMFAHGVRAGMLDPSLTGAYSPTVSTHTATNGHKFYATHFGEDNYAKVLGRWYLGLDPATFGPYKRIQPPETP